MIWLISCLIMLVATLSYVFCLPRTVFVGPVTTRAEYLRERKKAVYENLRDLNFEFAAGKVPVADYTSLKSSLQDEAASRGLPLRLHVARDNHDAARLYQRLGFIINGDTGSHFKMEWRRAAARES